MLSVKFGVTLKIVTETSDLLQEELKKALTALLQTTSEDASRPARLVLRDELFPVRITFKGITCRDSNLVDKSFFQNNIFSGSIPVFPRSKGVSQRRPPCLDRGFESRRRHRCPSLASVVCCQRSMRLSDH
jgi:hypothetical protein